MIPFRSATMAMKMNTSTGKPRTMRVRTPQKMAGPAQRPPAQAEPGPRHPSHGTTIIIATHDDDIIRRFGHPQMRLENGTLIMPPQSQKAA